MQTAKCFKRDERGTTATFFGLTLIPVMVLLGAAVDYSRAGAAHARMQRAVDAATLALSRDGGLLSDSELQARAQDVFTSAFGADPSVTAVPVTVTRQGRSIRVEASGTVRPAFMRIAGFNEMPISGTAVAARKKIELALVLDNTGSMASKNKLQELKRASRTLLDKLETAVRDSGDEELVKVSIVPFNSKVNVGRHHKDAWWITYRPHDANPALRMSKDDWQGCVTDREQLQDLDARDDRRITGDPSTLHLATVCGEYFGNRLERQELAEIRPLTNDFQALRQTIGAMRPDGCTNITIGAAWGLDTLSNQGPFTGAAAYGAPDVDKFMILLTDGNNTRSRAYRNSDCSEGPFISGQIDPRTRKVCDNIKSAGGQGIRLYTIRVIEGNATLLSECASTDENGTPRYYDVGDASRIQGVFQDIVNEILATRLTH
jgi:Flp pilus assembly protein TadG